MSRLDFALVSSLAIAAVSGCSPTVSDGVSQCEGAATTPACETACNPAPGAPNICPSGYHCAADGYCDAVCTPNGGECGEDNVCSADGRCLAVEGDEMGGPDASCPAVVFTPKPVTPSIQLLLDRSGSMAETDIAPTRYQAMRSALTSASGIVSQLQAKAYIGSQLYGCNGSIPSNVFVPRALNNALAINTSIQSVLPAGNTPTPTAIDAAVASFTTSPPPADSPPAIVLATDGLPNTCPGGIVTESESVQAARNAYAAGIPVYVLAINQSSAHFQQLANAGQGWQSGQPNVQYFPVSTAADLKSAFEQVINNVVSCDLSLTSNIDASRAMGGTLTVNGTTYAYGANWTVVNGNMIRLESAACASLKSSPSSSVSASFPCGSVIL